jgi:HNH endonuclease
VSNIVARFWSKVDRTGGADSCWLWKAGTRPNEGGQLYGRFNVSHGLAVSAHRFAYQLYHGTLEPKLVIDHLCRNTLCVNPQHMEAVTHAVNILRGVGKGALNARKTHCKRGHVLDLFNTYWIPKGGRACRQCQREIHDKGWKQRNRKASA